MSYILGYLTWSVGSTLINFGILTIRWYGLLFALGFVLGYMIMEKIFLSEGKSQKDLESLTITMILGTVLGARIGHCIFYDPAYYLSNPIEILKVWEGGLASHGAAIGILLALWYYVKKNSHIGYLWILDRISIVIALAGALIRTGNFFNSEILGAPATVPWAIVFTHKDMIPRHPAQLYEAILCVFIFIALYAIYKKSNGKPTPGLLFGNFLYLIFGSRFIIEFFKEVQSPFELSLPLHMGQILSIPLILAGFYLVFKAVYHKTLESK